MRSPGISRAPSQGEKLSLAPRNHESNAFGAYKLEGCEGRNWRVEKLIWYLVLFGIWYLVFDVLLGFHNNIRNVGLHVRR